MKPNNVVDIRYRVEKLGKRSYDGISGEVRRDRGPISRDSLVSYTLLPMLLHMALSLELRGPFDGIFRSILRNVATAHPTLMLLSSDPICLLSGVWGG